MRNEPLAGDDRGEIRPVLDFISELGFSYPQVEKRLGVSTPDALVLMEFLHEHGILDRSLWARFLLCRHCGSLSLTPGKGCPQCGSSKIAQGTLVEHSSCGQVSLESEFAVPGHCECPRCGKAFQASSPDYRNLGTMYKCGDCGGIFREASLQWRCQKCSVSFSQEEPREITLYSYIIRPDQRRRLEVEVKPKLLLIQYLSDLGYELAEGGKIRGRSGVEHTFDLIARRDEGLLVRTVAVAVLVAQNGQVRVDDVLRFDSRAGEVGIREKVLLATPALDEGTERLATSLRICTLDDKKVALFFQTARPRRMPTAKAPPIFESRSQFVGFLRQRGYGVEENARLPGKTGTEQQLDIFAHRQEGFLNHTLAATVIIGRKAVGLKPVSLFCSAAEDAGVIDMVLLVSPGLSSKALRFAQGKQIKVYEIARLEEPPETRKAHLTEAGSSVAEPPEFVENPGPDIAGSEEVEPPPAPQPERLLSEAGSSVAEPPKFVANPGPDIAGSEEVEPVPEPQPEDLLPEEGPSMAQPPEFVENPDPDIAGAEEVEPVPEPQPEDLAKGAQVEGLNIGAGAPSSAGPEANPLPLEEQVQVGESARQAGPAEPGNGQPWGKPQGVSLPEPVENPGPAIACAELDKPPEEARSQDVPSGPRINLLLHLVVPEALQRVPEDLARKFCVIPLSVTDGCLQVAVADPSDIMALEALTVRTGMRIETLPASAKDICEAIDFSYKAYDHIAKEMEQISPAGLPAKRQTVNVDAEAPVTRALQFLLEEAAKSRASDIQIEPEASQVRIRYRIDGSLHEVISMPREINEALISRVKILANMNIADARRPQDGQFTANVNGKEIDIRVGTANTVHGEMAVLRLLDKAVAVLTLDKLGFNPTTMEQYEAMIRAPWGMLLVSGPTGAGKTTTLYATVNSLDRVGRHIVTIEDPVEYRFEGINQMQVNAKAGLTFATGLRSVVRLSPDVILVGEIRDGETATIATQSALTGHLVLSSVHANDSVGVLFRLLDLGVEPFLVCASVIGIVAQRLLRRLCTSCTKLTKAPLVEQLAYTHETGEKRSEFHSSAGCKRCGGTGYLGRVGIFELLRMTDEVKRLLMAGVPPAEIRAQAIKEGMVPLVKDGMLKVKAGLTTPREVLRNAFSSEQ